MCHHTAVAQPLNSELTAAALSFSEGADRLHVLQQQHPTLISHVLLGWKVKRNRTSVYFLAELVPGAQISIQARELTDYVWLSATPAKQRMNYPEMSQLIDAAMAQTRASL